MTLNIQQHKFNFYHNAMYVEVDIYPA